MQEPLPYLSYATPAQQPMLAFVKFVAITGICVATLSCLVDFASLYRIAIQFAFNFNLALNVYRVYQLVSAIAFALLAVALMTTCIGCLRRKELARVWIIRYAIVYLIALGVDLVARPLLQWTPSILRWGAVNDPSMYRFMIMSVERSAVSAVFTSVLPIVIFIYMRKPAVRAVFV